MQSTILHKLNTLLVCPITEERMIDPVICSDGQTYERKNAENTQKTIVNPNYKIRKIIEIINNNPEKFLDDLIDTLKCIISMNIFRKAIICNDGHTYEQDALELWFLKSGQSPMTRKPIEIIGESYLIQNIIQVIVKDYPEYLEICYPNHYYLINENLIESGIIDNTIESIWDGETGHQFTISSTFYNVDGETVDRIYEFDINGQSIKVLEKDTQNVFIRDVSYLFKGKYQRKYYEYTSAIQVSESFIEIYNRRLSEPALQSQPELSELEFVSNESQENSQHNHNWEVNSDDYNIRIPEYTQEQEAQYQEHRREQEEIDRQSIGNWQFNSEDYNISYPDENDLSEYQNAENLDELYDEDDLNLLQEQDDYELERERRRFEGL